MGEAVAIALLNRVHDLSNNLILARRIIQFQGIFERYRQVYVSFFE